MDKENYFFIKTKKLLMNIRKRNQEITEEYLNNIEKLRKDLKKEIINHYKENLICSLNIFLGHYIEQFKKEKDTFYLNKLKDSIYIIQVLINKIKSKEFD